MSPVYTPVELVGVRGFEPPTPSSRRKCATRLRYTPTRFSKGFRLTNTSFDALRCCTTVVPRRHNTATTMTLTQSKVDKLQPKDKRYIVADSGGLSVCIQSSGAKTFQLRYRIHGRQKTLTFGDISLKDARAKAQAARVAIYEGVDPQEKAVLRKERQMSFGDFVQQHYLPHLRAAGKNAEEAEKMLSAQARWLWSKPITDIRLVDMKTWQNKQAIDKTLSTANRYTNAIKAVTRHAKYLGIVDIDPLEEFHRLSQPDSLHEIRWLTKKEEQALRIELDRRDFSRHGIKFSDVKTSTDKGFFHVSAKPSKNLEEAIGSAKTKYFKDHLTPAVVLMLECGLRRQEALKLRWADVQPTTTEGEFQLFINPKSEKTKKGRYVPLLKETLGVLLAWKLDQEALGIESEYVFPHPQTGKPLKSVDTAWDNMIARATKRCKTLAGITVKDLRSTYGSRLVQNGQPIFIVSKLLGHSSVTITEKHYAALSDEGKREAVVTLSTLPKNVKVSLLSQRDLTVTDKNQN